MSVFGITGSSISVAWKWVGVVAYYRLHRFRSVVSIYLAVNAELCNKRESTIFKK